MPRHLLTAEEFAEQARAGIALPPGAALWRATTAAPEIGSNGRTVRFVLSDPSLGRDGHTIAANAWVVDNYLRNPVFLWAHDSGEPPIGRVVELGTVGDRLMGTVEYADADISPFADMIYRMVRGGYLNATSAGWLPLEWRFSQDKGRVGGIDFIRVEALEFSQVPVPALPTALVAARGAGIDTGPMRAWAERVLDLGGGHRTDLKEVRAAATMPRGKRAASADWKMGAARDLPLDMSDTWDGAAAAERMLDAAGFNGDAPDSSKARRGFLAYDSANPGLKGSYKLPFADIVGGELKAVAGGIRNAASRLPQTDIPQDVQDEARAVLDGYEAKMKQNRSAALGRVRGLYHVGWLAMLLDDLDFLAECIEWESMDEGDASQVPAMLQAAINQLGQTLLAMTQEEVAELMDEEEGEATAAQRAVAAIARLSRGGSAPVNLDTAALARDLSARLRAGRVLSSQNEADLRQAHELIAGVLAQVPEADPAVPVGADETMAEDAAMRARKAKALKLKLAAPAA